MRLTSAVVFSVRLVAWRSAAVLARWECKSHAAGVVREGGVGAGGDLVLGWLGWEVGLDGWVVGLMGCGERVWVYGVVCG